MDLRSFQKECVELEQKIGLEYFSASNYHIEPIYDGLVDIEEYFNSTLKLVWILSKPQVNLSYSQFEGGGWHFISDVIHNQHFKFITELNKEYWYPIIQISQNLLKANTEDSACFKETFNKTGFLHLNKTNLDQRIEEVLQNIYLIKDQISCYKPDIIIAYKCRFEEIEPLLRNCTLIESNEIIYTEAFNTIFIYLETEYLGTYNSNKIQNCINTINTIINSKQ